MADTNDLIESSSKYIPFKLEKSDAVHEYKEFKHAKVFAPRIFHNNEHTDQIAPVYIPLWVCSGESTYSTVYEGSKVRTYTEKIDNDDYEVTETTIHEINQNGTFSLADLIVPATTTISEEYFERLMAFNLDEAIEDLPADIEAIPVDRDFDSVRSTVEEKMNAIAKARIEDAIKGFTETTKQEVEITSKVSSYKKVYLPVWLLKTEWNNETYQFVLNDQNGKIAGDVPTSRTVILLTGVVLFLITLGFVVVSDQIWWQLVGIPAHIIMYIILPLFISFTLTSSFSHQITMAGAPPTPTPNEPVVSVLNDSSTNEVVDVKRKEEKRRQGAFAFGGN